MTISMIAAVAEDNVIGENNDMPWNRIPADLGFFQKTTRNKTVIMGRKTYESIINSLGKALPNRRNIVLTSDVKVIDGVETCNTVHTALQLTQGENETFVIGGAIVYRSFMEYAKKLYITYIEESFPGDAFFPEIDSDIWIITSYKEYDKNELSPYNLVFVTYERR